VKKIFLLILIAGAWVAGYGYGRWYGKTAVASAKGAARILYYVDPMHPWYKSDKPGVAPDCNMKLVPVYEGEQAQYENKLPTDMAPGTVRITPEKQQLIGVEYGTAEYRAGVETVRAAAKVAMDETRIARVHSKIEGWIDQVSADFTGKYVEKGQPLLTIYSPEALATQQEYLLALKAKALLADDPMGHHLAGSQDTMLAAARKRLELWDISDEQIARLEQTKDPIKNLTLYAPISGFVTERNAFPRQRVNADTVLYTIADLSTVWVIADVFEYEAAQIHIGQAASMTMPYQPGRTFHGKVSYILPQVDAATRTLKVRIEFANPGNQLKPEMFGDVEFRTGGAPSLTVPQSAVLNSGLRQVIFVDRGDGYLEPRDVKTGRQFDGRIEILSGIKAGERIVTSGNFLIDSESQLNAAAGRSSASPVGHARAGANHDQSNH
jgi:RND family efflux transporter MFP subunit